MIVALGILALGACSSDLPGPTVAQAEVTLKADIDWLMKLIHAKDVKVTNEGGRNIPCGEGKSRRTYGVIGVSTYSLDDPVSTLNMLAGGLIKRGYKVVSADPATPRDELVKTESYVRVVTTSPKDKNFALAGETECLKNS
ncbi:hypothetical protein [Streptosporangium amethystogenes]|uniref:hypothetical protein n=1 Tax=Streptosporangium amethystogenes TaxID=2002 RepID=UPI0012F83E6F|nr:hypothetical protein [Streptosporangium amethystogenes]